MGWEGTYLECASGVGVFEECFDEILAFACGVCVG
jgi:hypothetical protein